MSTRVAVVHIRNSRPDAPQYQRIVDTLTASTFREIAAMGWDTTPVAAAEAGVSETLRATRNADLVVVLGGEDIDPSFYGGAPEYTGGGRHEPGADEAQIAVVHDAVARGVPLLGICRGHQIINVALGGTLVQHLETVDRHRGKRFHENDIFVTHELAVEADSAASAALVSPGEIVQSAHHQAIDTLGAGLAVAASADDGGIEAIVHTRAALLGVQWHPEHPNSPAGQLRRILRSTAALGNRESALHS